MDTNKITQIFKDYPMAVICLGVILICAVLIFLRGDHAAELSATEDDLNSRIRLIDKNVKNANDLDQELAEVGLLVEQIEARLFDKEERAVNINFFYDLEDQLDVRISNISQIPKEDATYAKGGVRALKLHSSLGFNIALKGSFEEILAFFHELHRVDPLIRIADFHLAVGRSRAIDSDLDARLRVLVLAQDN